MADVVRAALVQAKWTGDKASMLDAHENFARDAAQLDAHVICLKDLFHGPYFCQVQDVAYYEYAGGRSRWPHRATLHGVGRGTSHGHGRAGL